MALNSGFLFFLFFKMANCLIDTIANLLTLTNVSDSLIYVELDYLNVSSNPDFHRNSFGFFSEKIVI